MKRKPIDKTLEYAVTRIGYCIGGDIEKARMMAKGAGRFPSDICNKYGSIKFWGISHQKLYKEFQKTNPPLTEDLSFFVKNKKISNQINWNLAEWSKGTLQKSTRN